VDMGATASTVVRSMVFIQVTEGTADITDHHTSVDTVHMAGSNQATNSMNVTSP